MAAQCLFTFNPAAENTHSYGTDIAGTSSKHSLTLPGEGISPDHGVSVERRANILAVWLCLVALSSVCL